MYVHTEYDDNFMIQQHSQLFRVVLLLHLYLSHQQVPDSTLTQNIKLCNFIHVHYIYIYNKVFETQENFQHFILISAH